MAKAKGSGTAGTGGKLETTDFRYPKEKRKNVPPAQMAGAGKVPRVQKATYRYSPHLPPVLRFDSTGAADRLPTLLKEARKRALTEDELKVLAEALRKEQPWLEWADKQEQGARGGVRVDPVVLHIHERVSAQAIVRQALREDVQRDLFADPQQSYKDAVQFYKHDVGWANRLILGDSLQVMASLAEREQMKGKVQMIYMDPPYGIKFASNFQPEVSKRDVKDKDEDLTREPEMVKAYRDTWRLGVHSYLSYLRDRLLVARELLAETGSIFVQISDENVHRVRALMDEVFGDANFVSEIVFQKTGGQTSQYLSSIQDYVVWYAKNIAQLKYRQILQKKELGVGHGSGARYDQTDEDGNAFQLTSLTSNRPPGDFPVQLDGKIYGPSGGYWKTGQDGFRRLINSNRIKLAGRTIRYVRYISDFPAYEVTNLWTDTAGSAGKVYVVQTSTAVVQRCILMATDPGDVVLDPTCGSGTTAYVAEQWGRRWITIDTSRVALSIARQRILTARFDHYRTKDESSVSNPGSGFVYRTVQHITLKSIAQNQQLDPIFARHQTLLDKAMEGCNKALKSVTAAQRKRLTEKIVEKARAEGKRALNDADCRRWELPQDAFEHWSVPFDTDPDWPKALQDAVTVYRQAWRAKMDEVNACIKQNAEQEDLVNDPVKVDGVVRVSGPFSVEGVRPEELNLGDDGLFDGTPNEFEDELRDASLDYGPAGQATENLAAYHDRMIALLRQDGVTFLDNKNKRLAHIEPSRGGGGDLFVHAEGRWEGSPEADGNPIAVSFGPQNGPITGSMIEELIRSCRRYRELIIAGFAFDPEAAAVIQEEAHPSLRIHQVHVRPDVNPSMDDLLKPTPKSQLFSVFGQPDVHVHRPNKKKDEWVCTLRGVEVYDPLTNTVKSASAGKVAAWFLDSDFDGRCFCVTQAFFPDQDAWEKIAAALKTRANAEVFAAFGGRESLPFPTGKHRRVAVKVIDPRGNEVMAIHKLEH